MKPHQIIMLQVSCVGRTIAHSVLDRYGLTEKTDYLFFRVFGDDIMSAIEPELPQLVFTSHAEDCDAFTVARVLKRINPKAFVVAYTSTYIESVGGTSLDGYIPKETSNCDKLSTLAKAFRLGTSREELLQMLRKWSLK